MSKFDIILIFMKRLLLAITTLSFISALQAQIVINEGSNKNYSIIADEDGEFKDWIELYNAGASAVDVYNYTLTDDPAVPNKWVLPHLVIPAGGYSLIFCSGKNRYATSPFTMVLNTGSFSPAAGWNLHNFTTPFFWDGISNLVINVCSYSNTGYITNSIHRQTTTSYNSTLYSFQDGSDNACYDNAGSNATQRPNLRLNGLTIGNGVITNSPYNYPAPYGNWYWGARHQMMIRASELSAAGLSAGNINSLAFDIQSTDAVTYTYIEYSICSVSDNAMTNEYYPLAGFKNHTNFSLSSGGETVYLYSPSSILLSSLNVNCGELYDVSTGRFPNGSATLKKFQPATPDASNNGSIGYDALSLAPVFTVNSSFHATPFNVTILDPNVPFAQIYYTTDGSEPTMGSTLYNGALIPVYQSTVLRARAYAAGYLPSVVTSATYFFNVDHITPIISVITNDENLYGANGMFDNYWEDWLKAAHVEYFDSTDAHNLLFSQRAGIIMDGGYGGSRSNPQRSFRVKWGDGVLGEGALNYPIIPDRPLRTKYSDFYLRNGSNQWLNFPYKDAVQVKMLASGTNNYYSAWRPVTVYINGQYFGLYELREKYNTEMFKTLENADPDSTEILSLSAFYGYVLRALEGSVQNFYDSHDAFDLISPTDTSFWTQADQHFDMTWYNDYIIAESWMGNTDWPGNNIKIYRSNVTNQRWRFCVIDQELALDPGGWTDCNFDHIDYMLNQSTDNPYINIWLTGMQNGRFKNYFINRFADQMNTVYLPSRLLQIENGFFNLTVTEMANEYQRWGDPWNIPTQINDFYNRHLTFQDELTCRSGQVRDHIQDNFGLPQQVDLTLDVYPAGAGKIHISTITPDTYPWNGVYFDGVPVKIEAIANPGYTFLHWGNNGLIADTMNIVYNDTLETSSTQFTAYFASTAGIEEGGEQPFILYPSPTEQWLNVVNKNTIGNETISFEIVDINGRLAMNGILNTTGLQTTLQVEELEAGIYFIRFKKGNQQMVSLKFIKI
jgi:hypothetical protein